MRLLIIGFLLVNTMGFAQESGKHGTIKIRKNKEDRPLNDSIRAVSVIESFNGDNPRIVIPGNSLSTLPQYRGGAPAIKKYIASNIRYPDKVKKKKLSGICYTTFIVNSQGKISDVSIKKGIPGCRECDQEAIRLIESMGPWIPGTANGIKSSMQYDLPVEFKVE